MEIFRKKTSNTTATLNELIVKKITVCENEMKVNTAKKYGQLLSKVQKYYGLVQMSEVTPQFANDFKQCMVNSGNNNTTIASHLTMLRAIFNYAQYKGYVTDEQYPFQKRPWELDKVKIPKSGKRTDAFLTKDEMTKLYQWFITSNPTRKAEITAKKMVGLFLFSYLGNGANMADLLRLRYNTDYHRSVGKLLTFYRHKTIGRSDVKVRIPIIEKLQTILDYIADKPANNNFVLGSFLQRINTADEEQMAARIVYWNFYASKRTREVCKSIGINIDLSFTYARHTYSTVMHHSGVPFAIVEKNLGHSNSGNVAFNYIGDVPVEELFKYNELLLD